MKTRVGEEFFRRLKFDYGYVHDFDDSSLLTASDETRIDGYNFVFMFSDRAKGLKAFRFKVVSDAKGKLLEELALPDIASDLQKARMIPCKQALETAWRNGFPVKRSSILFVYDWESQKLVWDISDRKAVEPDEPFLGLNGKDTYRHIYVDAATGKVIKVFKVTIVV